jgi:hypothetical protein
MGKGIKEPAGAHEVEPVSISELIHQHVRVASWLRSATTSVALFMRLAPTPRASRMPPSSGRGVSGVQAWRRAYGEGGDELLTFFSFPKAQWKTLRTTNTIERLHEEIRRRVKTQGSLPTEDAALVLLFSLVASGQIRLPGIDGWRKIAAMLSQHTAVAA